MVEGTEPKTVTVGMRSRSRALLSVEVQSAMKLNLLKRISLKCKQGHLQLLSSE